MSLRFASLDNLLLSLRDSFVEILHRNLPANSRFLGRAISFLKTGVEIYHLHNHHGFDWHKRRALNFLQTHEISSTEVTTALKELRDFSPIPLVETVPSEVWDYERPTLVIHTHLKSTFANAVSNIRATGRTTFSLDDEKYLRFLLTHSCGWSATYPERMNDDWVKFFQNSYPHLKGLIPILDSLTYAEELGKLPDGLEPPRPDFFLLATAESYYVYDFTDGGCGLFRAGNTLEEVYIGMKEYKYLGWDDEPWEIEQSVGGLCDEDYLPNYYRKENGDFGRL